MIKKRGQVTLFIIIAVVLLIVIFSAVMFREQIARNFAKVFQPEAEPLRLYVEKCITYVGNSGIELMARQGGYVQIPPKLDVSFDGYLPRASAAFGPVVGLKTPMWWYKGQSYVPQKADMEAQLSLFMEQNLPTCFANFMSFPDLEIVERGNLTVTTEIHSKDVLFTVNYPITAKARAATGQSVAELENFRMPIQKNLGELYELGKSLMDYENNNAFIEDLTVDIISVADGAGDSPYFPMEGFDIRCPGKVWSEQFELIPDLQQMMHYNLNYVNFKGTYFTDPGYDYFRKQYSFRAADKNYPDAQVKLIYDKSYGMNLDVQPSSGDIVRGIPMKIPLLGQCFQIYHHRYTVDFPVRFQITDIKTGLVFSFATPVVIEKNQAKRYMSPFFTDYEYVAPTDDEFCANRQFTRTVLVDDAVTKDKISGVNIKYECVRFGCELGETKQPEFDGIPIYGSVPSLTTKFPPCLNGFVIASKEGYVQNVSQFTVSVQGGEFPPISLTPLKDLNMGVVVAELENGGLNIRGLNDGEIAVIFLTSPSRKYDEAFYYPPNPYVKNKLGVIYDDVDYNLDIKIVKNNIVTGGYFLDKWSLRRAQLSTANEVLFTVFVKKDVPKTNQEFADFWNNQVVQISPDYLPAVR